ncbi:MAG: TIM barrel protein [Opitutales bacterium]|jgi:sugar phosphate isomerase/epimerase|nr:TIM barrel protein [Opitutales bacterium]
MPFQLTGFTDEAEKSLPDQIATLKEVGWSAIELRLIDGANVCDQSEDEWKHTWEILQESGIQVVGFGGQIGNWSRAINTDFQLDVAELRRVAPRMREANCQFLRIMSYPNSGHTPLSRASWRQETIRRLSELSKIAEGEGVILGHENCAGYGETAAGFLELVNVIDSPAFQLIFDTGNNSLHDHNTEVTWDYYRACWEHVTHVHIKAAKPGPEGDKYVACYIDEDDIQEKILQDLEDTHYEGWLSIEPHMMAAVHAGQDIDDSGDARKVWLEYAKRLEKMVSRVTGK